MKKTTFSQYAIDNASILFLSGIRKDHTNIFRFTMTLTEDVCPQTLQMAVDRIYRRFPTVIAGIYPGFFHYLQVPAKEPPTVQPDPGCLLTMSWKELRRCGYRVYYAGKNVSIEAFHALTDGYGAIACFTTMMAEYLRLKKGLHIPVSHTLVDAEQSPMLSELEDSFLNYENGQPRHLPSRYAYQLPGGEESRQGIHISNLQIPIPRILDAAHRHGVTVTSLISTVMASSVMEVQQNHCGEGREKPVRIMVPVDLRRLFPSRTLRNFTLYAMPTLEPEDRHKPMGELLRSFSRQIQAHLEKKNLSSIMSYNVTMQRAWYYRMIPLALKCAILRLGCRLFGESNSSITVTNLGNVRLPEEMAAHVTHMDVVLTPRIRSPYNCAILSYNGILSINVSRFPRKTELEEIFFRNLQAVMQA